MVGCGNSLCQMVGCEDSNYQMIGCKDIVLCQMVQILALLDCIIGLQNRYNTVEVVTETYNWFDCRLFVTQIQ